LLRVLAPPEFAEQVEARQSVEQSGDVLLFVGDVVRHMRLGIGVVGASARLNPVVYFYSMDWTRIASTRLALVERREAMLAMLDGGHLDADRLKAAVVYLSLDDSTLHHAAAAHFAVCPDLETKTLLTSYLRSVPPPRTQMLRARINAARGDGSGRTCEETDQRRRVESNRWIERALKKRAEGVYNPAEAVLGNAEFDSGSANVDQRAEADRRFAEAERSGVRRSENTGPGRPEVRAALRRPFGESVEAHILRVNARLAEIGQPELTTRQRLSMSRGYVNHCWSCGTRVSSVNAIPCSVCGWYVCRECGNCHPRCGGLV
jgi:hypothetical protein